MSLDSFSIPTPTGVFGYSKYLYDVVEGLVTSVNANATKANDRHDALVVDISAVETAAATDRAAIRSEIADFETAVDASLSALQTAVDGKNAEVDASLSELFTWRANNVDEIATEVDKAINSKVSQTAYDAVVTSLQNADSALTTSLSAAIADRENKDTEHDGKLDQIEAFIAALLSTYNLTDASGNVLTQMSDF